MSEVQDRTKHRRSIPSLLLELLMIVVGVFLGASAEQWRETLHHHDLAAASLRNFRHEITANRTAIAGRIPYHVALARSANGFLQSKGSHSLMTFFHDAHFNGMSPVNFEHTAWDLAIATQALSDIEPRLAYAISHTYNTQRQLETVQNNFMQSAFTPAVYAGYKDVTGLVASMASTLTDINSAEPNLIVIYDRLVPQIDSALGGPPPPEPKSNAATPVPKPTTP